jgi:hypothetical protein
MSARESRAGAQVEHATATEQQGRQQAMVPVSADFRTSLRRAPADAASARSTPRQGLRKSQTSAPDCPLRARP